MNLRQRNAVILNVVAGFSDDLLDGVSGARQRGDQISPEDILIAGAAKGATVRLGQLVQQLGRLVRRIPGIESLLTCGDGIHPILGTVHERALEVMHQTRGGDDARVWPRLLKNRTCVL